MTYSLFFYPEIEEDLFSSYSWYEEKANGLGEKFLHVFNANINEIKHNPKRFHKIHNNFRRCLLRRFPYAIYFILKEDKITVFALFHCARNPKLIKDTLKKRQ